MNIGDTMPDGRTPNYLSLDRQFWEIGWRHMSDPEQKNEWSKYIVANLLQGQFVRDASNLTKTNRDTLRLQVGFFNMGAGHREHTLIFLTVAVQRRHRNRTSWPRQLFIIPVMSLSFRRQKVGSATETCSWRLA